jgi:hypothetical protein
MYPVLVEYMIPSSDVRRPSRFADLKRPSIGIGGFPEDEWWVISRLVWEPEDGPLTRMGFRVSPHRD